MNKRGPIVQDPNLTAFIADYRRPADNSWIPLDRILLRACAEQPLHQSVPEVYAKVTLINRVYKANLEMIGRDAEWNLAELMVKKGADKFIGGIAALGGFRRAILNEVLAAHEQFVCLVQELTPRVENSFCAKYLSFHYPKTIPIFDQFAYTEARKLVGHDLPKGLYSGNKNADYGYHCEAVLRLMAHLVEAGVPEPDIKRIDEVLYSNGRR
jgi:hypothetical protein